jgi:hypothetical protein
MTIQLRNLKYELPALYPKQRAATRTERLSPCRDDGRLRLIAVRFAGRRNVSEGVSAPSRPRSSITGERIYLKEKARRL